MEQPKSHQLVKRLIAPLTIWVVTKLLETRTVKSALQDVDARAHAKKRKAARSLRRAGRNAAKNPALLAAGAAAVAVGVGLMAKAARPKK